MSDATTAIWEPVGAPQPAPCPYAPERLAWRGLRALAADGPEAGPPRTAPASGGLDGNPSAEEIRVLLVDDNLATLARVAIALAPGCLIVAATREGHAALDAARSLRPDVIVLDISMPGMNGFELALQLRAAGSRAALVFLTVHNEDEFVQAAKAAGALAYVEKQRLAIDLLHAVREARAGRPFFPSRG